MTMLQERQKNDQMSTPAAAASDPAGSWAMVDAVRPRLGEGCLSRAGRYRRGEEGGCVCVWIWKVVGLPGQR